jgi:predicted transposase YbfD/YdcC
VLKREHNRGRLEIRFLECLEVTPSQVGFPGARLAARLETRVKRDKKWRRETVYLLSSLTLEELQARGMLALKRGYWVIESRLHHCLDITLREDQSRVRTPNAARVLGTIRRVIVSLANAAVDRVRKNNPKTKHNMNSFQKRFRSARGGRERLRALISAKSPNVLDLQS